MHLCFDISNTPLIHGKILSGIYVTGPNRWEVSWWLSAVRQQVIYLHHYLATSETSHITSFSSSDACCQHSQTTKKSSNKFVLINITINLHNIHHYDLLQIAVKCIAHREKTVLESLMNGASYMSVLQQFQLGFCCIQCERNEIYNNKCVDFLKTRSSSVKTVHQSGNGVEMMKFDKTNHSVTYTKYNHVLLTYLPGKSVGISLPSVTKLVITLDKN